MPAEKPTGVAAEMSAQGPVWTTAQVAARIGGYSEQTIRRMCEAGRFPGAYRNGLAGHWRIPEAAIEAYRESLRPKRGRARAAR